MSKRTILAIGTTTVLAAGIALAQGTRILYPDWSAPEKGTYAAPHGDLGEKVSADQPWTTTTVASAIDKPLKGRPMTVVGEIIDYSCYLQVGKHGKKHRDCGQKCIRAGQPVGLLAKDGTIYLLMDEEHDPRRDGLTNFRQAAVEHMAHVMKINGTFSEVAGQKALYVKGFVKQ